MQTITSDANATRNKAATLVVRRRTSVRVCAAAALGCVVAVCALSTAVLTVLPLAVAGDDGRSAAAGGTPMLRRGGRDERRRDRYHRSLSALNLRQYSLPSIQRDEKGGGNDGADGLDTATMRFRQTMEEAEEEVEERGHHDQEHGDYSARYLVNCTEVSRHGGGHDRGIYVHTATDPSFLMNVHDPSSVVADDNNAASLSMEMTGTYQQHLVNEILSALADAGPNAALVDVGGSNLGEYSLAAVASGHRAVAFEPVRANRERMCNSVNANPGFGEMLRLYNVAVVDRPTAHVSLAMDSDDATGTYAGEEGVDHPAWGVSFDRLLQDILPTRDEGPVVLKVDASSIGGGGECGVLQGGLDYLSGADLVHVQMRIGRDSFDDCPRAQEVVDVMVRRGLRPVLYDDDGTDDDDTFRELDPAEWRDWFSADEDLALFVSGHLVWKKIRETDHDDSEPEAAQSEPTEPEPTEPEHTEPETEPAETEPDPEQVSSEQQAESLRGHLVNCTTIANEDVDMENGVFLKTRTFPRFFINAHDPDLDPSHSGAIKKKGIFEGHMVYEMVREMKKVVEDDPDGSPPVFIDVGSHIGLYSLAVAAAGLDAIAFEPLESNWERMCRTVNRDEDLSFEEHVRVYSAAVVDDGPKLVSLGEVDASSNPGHAVVRGEVVGGAIELGMREGVDYASAVSLDSIRNDLPLDRPIFIKLDIGGGECGALGGGLEYLSGADLSYVQMEVTSSSPVAFVNCPRAQEVIGIMDRKGLLPFFFNRPGTSLWKILDPQDWTNWFNETNGDNVGHLVWKRKYW